MAIVIGPTFGNELIADATAKGYSVNGISWGADGTFHFDPSVSQQTIANVQAVLAAHNPAKQLPPPAPTPRQWLERLSPTTQAAIASAGTSNPVILLWLLKAAGNPSIDVTSAETVQGVGALVAAGIITSADEATLLAP